MRDVEARFGHGGQHRLGRRSGSGDEADPARQRAPLFRPGGKQRAHHDRRSAQMRDTMLGNRIEHRLGPHPTQADMGAADGGQRPGKAPAVAMEHRQRPEIDRMRCYSGCQRVGETHQRSAAVRVNDALRVARGAGRVIQRNRIPFIGRVRPIEGGITRLDKRFIIEERRLAIRAERRMGKLRIVVFDQLGLIGSEL